MTPSGMDRGRAPLVSVVMPAYNCAAYIAEALESVLGQTLPPHEVIVVDDGSTDNTRAALEPYATRIRYLHQANQGASAARNSALAVASGELIAFLDADDVWLPEKLQRQVQAMVAMPECGLVYTDGRAMGIPGAPVDTLISPRSRAWIDQHGTTTPQLAYGDLSPVLWLENCICSSSSVMVRRRCMEEVGGFDTTLRIAEDYDAWLQIGLRHPLAMVDRDLFRYRWRADSLSGTVSEREMRSLEAALVVIERHLESAPSALRPVIHHSLSRDYQTAARSHFKKNRFSEARPLFRASLRHDPGYLTSAAFLVAALLGRPFVRAARQVWSPIQATYWKLRG